MYNINQKSYENLFNRKGLKRFNDLFNPDLQNMTDSGQYYS